MAVSDRIEPLKIPPRFLLGFSLLFLPDQQWTLQEGYFVVVRSKEDDVGEKLHLG